MGKRNVSFVLGEKASIGRLNDHVVYSGMAEEMWLVESVMPSGIAPPRGVVVKG